jgi:hypothetical protein
MALTKIPSELSSTTGIVDNSNATAITIDSNENVGIGTTSPSANLDIESTTGNHLRLAYNSSFYWDVEREAATGDLTFTDASNGETVRFTDDGNLLVGTTANIGGARLNVQHPTDCIGVNLGPSASGTRYFMYFTYNGTAVGSIQGGPTSTSYNTSSDYRLKENVVELTGATERLKQLNPSRFNFITDADTTVDGFLAHEVADVVPEAVSGKKDAVDVDGNPDYQGIDQSKLVPLLVATIQELEARITELENN